MYRKNKQKPTILLGPDSKLAVITGDPSTNFQKASIWNLMN